MPDSTAQTRSVVNSIIKLAGLLVLAAGLIVAYIWDDLIFGSPIIATSAILGGGASFLIWFPIFWIGEFLISYGALKVYDRVSTGQPTRLERWLKKFGEKEGTGERAGRGKRLVLFRTTSKWLGAISFVLACFTLGGIAVTMILRYAGRRDGIYRTAFWASFWFALTFVGFYSGVGQFLVNLYNSIL